MGHLGRLGLNDWGLIVNFFSRRVACCDPRVVTYVHQSFWGKKNHTPGNVYNFNSLGFADCSPTGPVRSF